ncbi:MAG: hypothetical protein KME31_19025 [Tolypothrix carrinoi HA7290-LM1]|nr:hypothetical protein [Tolypothrix carrinoi HA7290-LM1]
MGEPLRWTGFHSSKQVALWGVGCGAQDLPQQRAWSEASSLSLSLRWSIFGSLGQRRPPPTPTQPPPKPFFFTPVLCNNPSPYKAPLFVAGVFGANAAFIG